MAPWLLFLVVGLVGANRSARILHRSESPNDIENGTRNVSLVFGLSACNSTSCVSKVRLKPTASRRNDGFRQPSRGLLPPYHSVKDSKHQRSTLYSYPKPQEDIQGYMYTKPQQDDPMGYDYSKPKPQQDEPFNGYTYPKPKPQPQQDKPSSGYSYPKPQQDEPLNGYSYPKPIPQQDEPSNGYSYPKPKPQQDEPLNGYSYPKPKPQQDEPSNGYSYPKPKPQQDEPSNGYSYPKPKPQQDELSNGSSHPKPQQDELSDGYSYPKPQKSFADALLDDYSSRYQPGSRNRQEEVQTSIKSWDYSTWVGVNSWKPMVSDEKLPFEQETSAPLNDEPIDIPVPQNDSTEGTPESSLVPPNKDESPWTLYDESLQATHGLPQPQDDPPDSYVPPQQDLKPPPVYDVPNPQEDPVNSYAPPQNDPQPPRPSYGFSKPKENPAGSYFPPQNDYQPPKSFYGSPQPTQPPQQDPVNSYLPPRKDPLPTYGPPSRPTLLPQNDPANSYLPPQNDPLPNPSYGPPARPTHPPQNDPLPPKSSYGPPSHHPEDDPADSYLPPQNDPLPNPSYGPPARPTRPPQNDPLPTRPSYGPPARPTRPPQNDPADSYLPSQNDPLPNPTYGPPARPTRPPQNDPLPPKPSYGPPARPTRPPPNDPADSYLPLQYDPLPNPTYGPPARPTRPPQNDPLPPKPSYGPPSHPQNNPSDSYLPPQDDPISSYGPPTRPPQNDPVPPKPIYGLPARPTRPPQNLNPQNDPIPTYGPPDRPTAPPQSDPLPVYGAPQKDPANSYLPPQNDPKPPPQAYGPPQEITPPSEDTPSNPYWPEVDDNKSNRALDDPASPVYVPFQEETDARNLPDGNRPRVLRVPGGLQPGDIHVTDLRCWRSAPSSVFAFTLWTTKKMAAPPVLIAAESTSFCRLRGDSTAPRSRYLVRLAHADLARCGVRPCTANGEERMCVTLQLPQLTGIRLASDPLLEVSCAPPPPSDWSLKQLRMAAAAPPLGPPELRVKGGRSPLHTQLQLYRRTAPGGTWRRIESSQSVVLGEELQLRALVRAGDGWQSSKLGDVVVRRTNTGEDFKSTATLSDSTSAISARLVTPEGCPNPDMEDVTGLQSWLAGDPLVSMLPIRVFMFRGQKDGEQIVISAKVTACQDRLHCKMEARQCEAANAATRVKRSISNDDETSSSEEEISLRVVLPASGVRAEQGGPKQRSSLPIFTPSKLVACVLAPGLITVLVIFGCLLYRSGIR